jgi:hypothetical protein
MELIVIRIVSVGTLLLGFFCGGCSHYEGLDPGFARATQQRNRVLIGWCVTKRSDGHVVPVATVVQSLTSGIREELENRDYIVKLNDHQGELRTALKSELLDQASADETLPALMALHQGALQNINRDWTEQSTPIQSSFLPFEPFPKMTNALRATWEWPPQSVTLEQLASVDAILFWETEYYCETSDAAKKRRKENWVRASLVFGVEIPLTLLAGGGITGAPNPVIKGNTSWMQHTILLLNPTNGAVLYRQHRYFDGADVRKPRTLRSNVARLFGDLPNAR